VELLSEQMDVLEKVLLASGLNRHVFFLFYFFISHSVKVFYQYIRMDWYRRRKANFI